MKPAAGCVFARSLTYGNFKIVFTSCFQLRYTLTANVVTMACTANAGRKREGKSIAIGLVPLPTSGGGAVAVTADSRTALQVRCIFNVFFEKKKCGCVGFFCVCTFGTARAGAKCGWCGRSNN